jgi:DNA-binding transcriptional regulator YiaG
VCDLAHVGCDYEHKNVPNRNRRKKKVAIYYKLSQIARAMNEFTETTAENLRFLRGAKGLNQDDIGEMLGIPRNAVSKIESGSRSLSASEKTVLDWFFFGIMPPRLTAQEDLKGMLEFSPEEWRIIGVMAARAGQTHQQWIRSAVLNIVYGSGLITSGEGKADQD